MLNILFCIIFIGSLLNGFALGGSVWWSMLSAVITLAVLVLRLIFSKKIKALQIRSISLLGLVILLLIGLFGGMKISDSGYLSYNTLLERADGYLAKGEYYKAGEILGKLEKDYGTNDRLQLYKAQVALDKKDYTSVEDCLNQVANKQLDQYYTLLGRLYVVKKDYARVQDIFIGAAKTYPLWVDVQRIAGAQAVDNKDYAKGEYFLLRATEQAPRDPIPLYYLGVICYKQEDFNKADNYFSEALRFGLNNEYASYIAWYRQNMGGNKQ